MSPDTALPQPPSFGAGALLRWLLRRAAVPVTLATLAACTSNIIQAIVPAFLGQALDAGIENGLNARIWGIGALLLVLFVVYAVGDTMLSYFGVQAWMRTAFDVDRLVGRQVSATGADLSRQVSTGEVATIIASDADYLGKLIQHLPALLGAAASFIVVAVLMLRTSVSLGLVVILGMPLVAAIVTLVIRPLQKRQAVQREAQSAVTTITTDTVAGLRILRGIGGEDVFARRYRDASQELRRRGVEVASSQATLMTLQVLLPGLFAAIVVWVAARMAVAGSLSPGGLITFYGYTAYLSWPLWVFTNSVQDYTRAVVGARRLSRLLEVTPAAGSLVERLDLDPAAAHPVSGDLVDTGSDLRLEEGRMTALVCPDPEVSAELATRLGRFTDSGPTVTLAGRPLTTMPLDQVRASIVVAGATAQLFTGTLREALDVRGGPDPQPAGLTDLVRAESERTTGADVDQQVRAQERDMPGDDRLLEAIEIADAGDVLTSLSEGLAGMITEKGRSLSGGQRQRVALARALLTEAPTLVLIEPTSALDSHTEARVAAQVHRARAGRTTVVVTASPLVLEACDEVILLDSGGTELLHSTHRELMTMARSGDAQAADYRAVVSRAMGEDAEVSC
ncbi:ABC transporter ATP-binding protein [Actinomyces naeslundii]|uniref:ABC transporter transmembrane region n=2 Tax=Actinomyces naeslundii TaxID=1655 RepID=J3ABV8_ACTNH|nr:ABC transporter ATP-binding protein [Actinomyces naeslundii]EJN85303.1 ABC transporter transmembrane region [Actinomyces naeslundii str. Howell 279]OMG35764.1 ABC transporter permease [Actinomyces naeslundii]QQC21628.1 ABC transporter ATP-binding protein [Actinomyces naeslundii]